MSYRILATKYRHRTDKVTGESHDLLLEISVIMPICSYIRGSQLVHVCQLMTNMLAGTTAAVREVTISCIMSATIHQNTTW